MSDPDYEVKDDLLEEGDEGSADDISVTLAMFRIPQRSTSLLMLKMVRQSGSVITAMAHGASGITARSLSIYLGVLTFKNGGAKLKTNGW